MHVEFSCRAEGKDVIVALSTGAIGRATQVAEEEGVFDLEVDGKKYTGLSCFWNGPRELYVFSGGKLPQLAYHVRFDISPCGFIIFHRIVLADFVVW